MHYSTSAAFSITLFSFLSFLAFNNRIENLTLIPKFLGAPCFRGGPEAVPLLPAGRAGPANTYVQYNTLYTKRVCIAFNSAQRVANRFRNNM